MAELRFPVRDPSDDLACDLGVIVRQAAAEGQLDETEAPVIREIGMRLILDGARTFEDAIDWLEDLGEAGQRQWLDEARLAVGLDSATELEQERERRRIDRRFEEDDIPPPRRWSEWQGCPAAGCRARPTDSAGALRAVSVNQWWCPSHEHLAAEGDLSEYEPPYLGLGLNGQLIPSEKEKARIAEEIRLRDEPRERERQQREEHARREGEALDEVKERYSETAKISFAGVQVSPRDVHIHERGR